jgi:hypothetical protein
LTNGNSLSTPALPAFHIAPSLGKSTSVLSGTKGTHLLNSEEYWPTLSSQSVFTSSP